MGREAPDADLPSGAGPFARLHLAAGRLAIGGARLLRGRISLGARLLALDEDGRVCLVRHSYLPGLHLPGGGVEPGETARDAVLREAREEAGLETEAAPELFHLYWNPRVARGDHVALFVARGARLAGRRARRAEIVAAAFHPPDALPDDVVPATRARLAEVLQGRAPAETW